MKETWCLGAESFSIIKGDGSKGDVFIDSLHLPDLFYPRWSLELLFKVLDVSTALKETNEKIYPGNYLTDERQVTKKTWKKNRAKTRSFMKKTTKIKQKISELK